MAYQIVHERASMNSRKESGSAHIIIIIVLIVALLGALGYIFWQQLSAKENTKAVPTTQTNEDTTYTPEPEIVEPSLVLDKWAVNIPVKDFVATYTIGTTEAGNYYDISSNKILDFAKKINCDDTSIGVINQETNSNNIPSISSFVKIGEIYYFFAARSQAACVPSDGGSNPQFDEYNQIMTDAINSFKEAFPKSVTK